jgi:DNA-binding NtrC family response regulator
LGTADPGGRSERRAHVLIVDDEPGIRSILADYLTEQGYTIATVSTGAAAIAAIRERRFDAVLLDLNMPGVLDGRVVLSVVGRLVPVIVVSAISDVTDARATLAAGAFDFVSKPFDLERLEEIVATAVATRRAP